MLIGPAFPERKPVNAACGQVGREHHRRGPSQASRRAAWGRARILTMEATE